MTIGETSKRDLDVEPTLYIVIPCYNESQVLPITLPLFTGKLEHLIKTHRIAPSSRIVLVDDGSKDDTWHIAIKAYNECNFIECMSLSRNHGHQNALLAGLMESRSKCDITVSMDADGQDDIEAIDLMVDAYLEGNDIVYGVRSSRDSDTLFKRSTARTFYRALNALGAKTIPDHADYRLLSRRALDTLANYQETNLFLRGLVPLLGFPSSTIAYVRAERIAGETHYPLAKMVNLAFDGITSLSVKPLRIILVCGFIVSSVSIAGIAWSIITALAGEAVSGWASIVSIVCLLGGIQIFSLGIIGEYVGKIYMESKHRPRYIVQETTLTDTREGERGS